MIKIFFAFFLFSVCNTNGQVKVGTKKIGNHLFTFKTTLDSSAFTDEPITSVSFFKKNIKLLSHKLREIGGDHNSAAIELGTYQISDSTVTFYSYWARAGDAPVSPFGGRKQVYKVSAKGILYVAASEMYIETSRQGWEENKGIEFLFKPPKSANEKIMLLEYIKQTEKEYNAHFVFGVKANALLKEIRSKLKNEIDAETKNWSKVEAYKTFGYKK